MRANRKITWWVVGALAVSFALGIYTARPRPSVGLLCSQRQAAQTAIPEGFGVTPQAAVRQAQAYFVSNPFELVVYADRRFYYVDLATSGLTAARARARGVKIDGRSGRVVRGQRLEVVK